MKHPQKFPRKVVCLLGATGTGKTAAALALDQVASIINYDSRQTCIEYSQFPHTRFAVCGRSQQKLRPPTVDCVQTF